MEVATLFIISFLISSVENSLQDCRVLAECDGIQAQWRSLASGCKNCTDVQAPPGPTGRKGEPAADVYINELKDIDERNETGPRLYYYVASLTWHTSEAFCKRHNRTLCMHEQLCSDGNAFIDDVMTGNHWVAIVDTINDWTQIGDYHSFPCIRHLTKWGRPPWGTTNIVKDFKGYVYCCETEISAVSQAMDIRYQYIGSEATYRSSMEHCKKQGRRLCHSSDVCGSGIPVRGTVRGDKWIAVQDRFNEWIQIGDSRGRTCKTHSVLHGAPDWGIREDGTSRPYLGYVFCCKHISVVTEPNAEKS